MMKGIKNDLTISDLEVVIEELRGFHEHFQRFFRVKTRDVIKQSLQYLQGLFIAKERKNMTNMEKSVPDCNHQSLQNFISDSQWDEEGVISEIQRKVSELIGNPVHGSVHIDESGFLKSGKNSVGVSRQYCGRFGKVENCQVGVFLGYTHWNRRTLIDRRLYLPEDWANDPVRREQCGVPAEITFKTKAELGLEILSAAKERGVPFAWVGIATSTGSSRGSSTASIARASATSLMSRAIRGYGWNVRRSEFRRGRGSEVVIPRGSGLSEGSQSKCGS